MGIVDAWLMDYVCGRIPSMNYLISGKTSETDDRISPPDRVYFSNGGARHGDDILGSIAPHTRIYQSANLRN